MLRSKPSVMPPTASGALAITGSEIRAQLEHILASKAFRNSARLQRFLKLAVERTLAGEPDQLKEYAIGHDDCDRGPTYDPLPDSIVGVEPRRLRKKLREFYAAQPDSPVVIHFPPGSYV